MEQDISDEDGTRLCISQAQAFMIIVIVIYNF